MMSMTPHSRRRNPCPRCLADLEHGLAHQRFHVDPGAGGVSPATMTTPVLTRVSQATRPRGSAAMIASSMASEIWSATLSGWPSETD